jgi:hypothetical protein
MSLPADEYPTTDSLLQLTNSEAGGHLTPTFYSFLNWLQLKILHIPTPRLGNFSEIYIYAQKYFTCTEIIVSINFVQ